MSSVCVWDQVIPLTERAEGGARNITVEGAGNWTYQLRELSPGATYQLHAFTLLHDKESAAYASRNFTTSELHLNLHPKDLSTHQHRSPHLDGGLFKGRK